MSGNPAGIEAEHQRVMADVVREVWRLAQQWTRDDDTEPLADSIFTAMSPLVAWEDENGVPSTVADPL